MFVVCPSGHSVSRKNNAFLPPRGRRHYERSACVWLVPLAFVVCPSGHSGTWKNNALRRHYERSACDWIVPLAFVVCPSGHSVSRKNNALRRHHERSACDWIVPLAFVVCPSGHLRRRSGRITPYGVTTNASTLDSGGSLFATICRWPRARRRYRLWKMLPAFFGKFVAFGGKACSRLHF